MLETRRDLLGNLPNLLASVALQHVQLDSRARAAWTRTKNAPLATTAIDLVHTFILGIAQVKSKVAQGPRVSDGTYLLSRRLENDVSDRPVETATGVREGALNAKKLLRLSFASIQLAVGSIQLLGVASVQHVHVPGHAIVAAAGLHHAAEEVCLLHRIKHGACVLA